MKIEISQGNRWVRSAYLWILRVQDGTVEFRRHHYLWADLEEDGVMCRKVPIRPSYPKQSGIVLPESAL